jgi:hypothetical protein
MAPGARQLHNKGELTVGDLIDLLIWLFIVLLVTGAFLALVRAILATPPFAEWQPYAAVLYALIVLIVVLVVVGAYSRGGFPIIVSRGHIR